MLHNKFMFFVNIKLCFMFTNYVYIILFYCKFTLQYVYKFHCKFIFIVNLCYVTQYAFYLKKKIYQEIIFKVFSIGQEPKNTHSNNYQTLYYISSSTEFGKRINKRFFLQLSSCLVIAIFR